MRYEHSDEWKSFAHGAYMEKILQLSEKSTTKLPKLKKSPTKRTPRKHKTPVFRNAKSAEQKTQKSNSEIDNNPLADLFICRKIKVDQISSSNGRLQSKFDELSIYKTPFRYNSSSNFSSVNDTTKMFPKFEEEQEQEKPNPQSTLNNLNSPTETSSTTTHTQSPEPNLVQRKAPNMERAFTPARSYLFCPMPLPLPSGHVEGFYSVPNLRPKRRNLDYSALSTIGHFSMDRWQQILQRLKEKREKSMRISNLMRERGIIEPTRMSHTTPVLHVLAPGKRKKKSKALKKRKETDDIY